MRSGAPFRELWKSRLASPGAHFPYKVRDFIRTHHVPVLEYPHLETTDEVLRQRRRYFGEYMLFATAIVELDGRIVLVQQHYGRHLDGGYWKTPGGGVGKDEPIPAAIRREVKEETNLDVELLGPAAVIKTGRRAPTEGTIDAYVVVFAAQAAGGDLQPGDPGEIAAVCLSTVQEVEEFIAEGVFGGSQPYFRAGEIECVRRWAADRGMVSRLRARSGPAAAVSPVAFDRPVRLEVYRRLLSDGHAPAAAEIGGRLAFSTADGEAALRRLADGRMLVLRPGTTEVLMANPLSAIPTSFRVETPRGAWWGNCIWDALGIPAMLRTDARVVTRCPDCDEPLTLSLEGGRLLEPTGVIHFQVPATRWWDDIVFT